MDSKELIRQTLDFWKYKLDNNLCTMEELDELSRLMQKELNIIGTAEDFAKFYGKPEQRVRNVIHQKVLEKPKRRVFHRFLPFVKNIPKSWLINK